MIPGLTLALAGLPPAAHGSQSGRGFIAGPVLLQHVTIALGLSGPQTSALFEILRCAIEGERRALDRLLVERLDLDLGEARALLESLVPQLLLPGDGAPIVERLGPFIGRMRTISSRIYRPLRLATPVRSPVRRVAAPAHPTAGRPDLFVLTGFLGSGKTTQVNALLQRPEFARSIVFVNEIGEAAVDHLVVRAMSSPQDILLMRNGCLCCAYGNELINSLRGALALRAAGDCAPFDRIVVETSGMADPGAVVRGIQQDVGLQRQVRFRGVATTIDLVAATADQPLAPEARSQIALADWFIFTKADMVEAEAIAPVVARVRAMNPAAETLVAPSGAMLAEALLAGQIVPSRFRATPGAAAHDPATRVMTLRRGAVDETAFRLFSDLLMMAKGDQLYRMKGLLRLKESPDTFLVQAVRGSFHDLEPSQIASDGSALTIIARGIDPVAVDRLLELVEMRCAEAPSP